MALKKSEFRNTRDHHIGVVTKREDGKMKGIDLPPDARIWLDEDEQIATANAPRDDTDNPFINGDLELLTSARLVSNRRPIGDSDRPNPDEVTAVPKDPESPAGQETPPADGAAGDSGEGAEGSSEPAVPESKGDGSDGSKEAGEKAQAPPEGGKRQLTRAQQEANSKAAAAHAVHSTPEKLTGAAPKPQGKAPEGSRKPGEEVGTPAAAGKGGAA